MRKTPASSATTTPPFDWEDRAAVLNLPAQYGSLNKAAKALGVAPSTVKSRFHRHKGRTKVGVATGRMPQDGTTEEDERELHDAVYWRTRAERLEDESKQYGSLLGNIRVVMEDVLKEHPQQVPLPAYYQPVRRGITADEELTFIFISDTHVGELVRASDTMGLSTYSTEEFVERCETYKKALDVLVNGHLRKVYPLRKAFVCCLGDIAAGEDVFPMQQARIDRKLMYQAIEGAGHLAQVVRYICGMFEEVTVYLVPGNHGKTKTTTLNTDVILYCYMALLLENQPNCRVVLSDCESCAFYIDPNLGLLPWPEGAPNRRWNFMLTHGHQARGWAGTPYYGLDRMTQRLALSTKLVFDHLWCGHHHSDATAQNWTVVGSWVGGTDFSVSTMQSASRPTQLIQGFHPRQGLTWRFPVYLGEDPCLSVEGEAAPGIYTPHNDLLRKLRP